jgi:hypothetical protein
MQNRIFNKTFVAIALAAALIAGLARPSQALFDKTRFAAHLGIAYFCFHHWVSNPYREGKFVSGAPHRTASIIKAGAALLFAVHELKVSNKIAHQSKDPLLQKLAGSLDNMTSSFSSIGDKFKSGHFDKRDVDSLNGSYNTVDNSTRQAGINVKDVPIAIPGS